MINASGGRDERLFHCGDFAGGQTVETVDQLIEFVINSVDTAELHNSVARNLEFGIGRLALIDRKTHEILIDEAR